MNKKVVFLLALFVLVAFYWFVIRPTQIRKDCNNEALDYSLIQGITGSRGTEEGRLAAIERKKLYDASYEYCVHSEGLEE